MFYDDYDLDYAFELSYDLDELTSAGSYLDENASAYTYDLDEDYARDTYDLDALAYRHYAWYNVVHAHTASRHMLTHTKRLIRVTLDIECYEDLDLDNIEWNDVLGLEGDEDVDVRVTDYSDVFWENIIYDVTVS